MELHVSLTVGLILAAGALMGAVARFLHLPALTGYITAGLLLGHHGLNALPERQVELLSGPVNDIAMALVLFVLGGQFHKTRLGGKTGRLVAAALLESAITILLVTATTWAVLGDARSALMLGVLAVAVAPATTLLVQRELRAAGPLTERITLLTGLSNWITVVLFEVALLFLVGLGGPEMDSGVLPILWDLAGSLLFGLLAGHALILLQMRIGRGNLALPLLTVLFLTIGVCHWLDVPHMLAFMVTGAVVANRSQLFDSIVGSMDHFAKPAYVAFFVLSGLHLDLAVFWEAGWAVGVYVCARTLGKVIGTRMAGRVAGLSLGPSQQAGPGLLCQAGAAIALAGVAARYDAELGRLLLNVILGGVALFELVGPVLLRQVTVASGEVPMGQLLVRADSEAEGISWWQALLHTLKGRRGLRGAALEGLTVEDLMRPNPASLPAKAGLAEILRFADHSPYNDFPVVGEDERLVGVIPLTELDMIVYDPKLRDLVIAEDLVAHASGGSFLAAGDSLREAARFFQGFQGNTVAVVADREACRLVGMLPRSEVLLLARHLRNPAAAD